MTHSSIAEVRETLGKTRAALVESTDLPGQILALEAAVAQLREVQQFGDLAAEAEEIGLLREEVQRVQALVRHGEEFWQGWARLLGMDTGYAPTGCAPAMAPAPVSIDVEG